MASVSTWLVLPGTSGNYASIPDSAGLSPSSNITLLSRVAATDWTPAANQRLINKSVVGVQFSYIFLLLTTGKLRLSLSSAGTANVTADSSVAPTIADGATLWVLATWRASDGRTQFFTASGAIASPVASDFTQLGTNQTLSVASIFDSSQAVELGSGDGGTANLFVGNYYRAMMYDGVFTTAAFGGTKQLDVDFTAQTPSAIRTPASFTEGSANAATVTLNGAASWYWGSAGTSPGLVLPGVSGQYASAPDSAAVSVSGDIDIRFWTSLDSLAPAFTQYFVTHYAAASRAFYFGLNTAGRLLFGWSSDGTTDAGTPAPGSTLTTLGLSTGVQYAFRVTFDADNGAAGTTTKTYYSTDNGVNWNLIGTTTAGGTSSIFNSTAPIEVGSRAGGANPMSGKVQRAQIRSNILDDGTGIVFDANFAAVTVTTDDRTPSTFTESSSNTATVTINGTAAWEWRQTVSVNAGNAAGTGSAGTAAPSTQPNAGNASATGSAGTAAPSLAPNASSAAGTGAAANPAPSLKPNAGNATGTGTAANPAPSSAASAGSASGTGTAQNPAPAVSASAGAATGTGTSFDLTAALAAAAAAASGTGSSYGPYLSLAPNAGNATGTGTGYDATVVLSGPTVAATATVSDTPSAVGTVTDVSVGIVDSTLSAEPPTVSTDATHHATTQILVAATATVSTREG